MNIEIKKIRSGEFVESIRRRGNTSAGGVVRKGLIDTKIPSKATLITI